MRRHTVCKYLYLFLLMLFFSCKSKNIGVIKVITDIELETLLLKDFNSLSTTLKSNSYSEFSKEIFNALFLEGLESSYSFLNNSIKENQKQLYKDIIKKTIKGGSKSSNVHLSGFENRRVNLNFNSTFEYSFNYEIFADFRGEWFGFWKDVKVNQHWLSPRHLNFAKNINYQKIVLRSFQTVFIGDGIGWNYNIEVNGESYILGYTCHFKNEGEIYMKRPHIGFNQKNKSTIWLTKDHIYLEYICKSENCHNLPLHYVITGANFETKNNELSKLMGFQAIYSVDSELKLDFHELDLLSVN